MNGNSQAPFDWLEVHFPELQDIQILSQGGQKQVFSASHPHDGDVVLKLMHITAGQERTEREILAVTQVQSTRVPKILAQGTIQTSSGDRFWFREQRIHGQTVRERLAIGPFDTADLMRLALHVSEALVAAEAVNIVHRDVKPENIIWDPNNNFWLIDFGISRHLDLESLTASADLFGRLTWGYAPLEQCRNIKQDIDSRADLFALGMTLHECATGTNPFREGARDRSEVLRRVENGSLPPLQLNFASASDFADLVSALTQRRRIHRPSNVKEAHDWIKELCDREGVQ